MVISCHHAHLGTVADQQRCRAVQVTTEPRKENMHHQRAHKLVQRNGGKNKEGKGVLRQEAPIKEDHRRAEGKVGQVGQQKGEEGVADEGVHLKEQPEDGKVLVENFDEGGGRTVVSVIEKNLSQLSPIFSQQQVHIGEHHKDEIARQADDHHVGVDGGHFDGSVKQHQKCAQQNHR